MQLFHIIFTQPGKVILVQPCIQISIYLISALSVKPTSSEQRYFLTCQIIQHRDPSGVGQECDGEKSLVSDVNDIDSSAFGPWNVHRGGAPAVCGEFVMRFRQ